MIKKQEKFLSVIFIMFLFIFLVAGCGKKEENGEVQKPDISESAAADTANKVSEAPKDTIPDLTGNWTGIFDQRSATMSVIKQNGTEFSAIMTINYRQPLNKTVNGTIDPKTNTIKMEDLNASRYSGQYNAQLLNNAKEITGTFILRADNKTYKFNFKMK